MKRSLLASAAIMAAGASIPAYAQDAASGAQAAEDRSDRITDIVVTAQRRAESLQDVPVAVTAISGDRLANMGVSSTSNLTMLTPGLTVTSSVGVQQAHIRGIGTSVSIVGNESPVATYVDGVYIASAAASLLSLAGVERIEVLKGPQGTLFGRNATGGLIQVVTRDPSHTPSVEGDISFGSYKDFVANLYANTGLTDNLSANVALRYEHQSDGWGTNLATGNPVGNVPHDFAGRVKFLWNIGDTQVRLSADYENYRNRRATQRLGSQLPKSFDTPTFGGPYNRGGFYDAVSFFDAETYLKGGGASLQITHDFGSVKLTNITAYRQASFGFSIDTAQTPIFVSSVIGRPNARQFSEEINLGSTGSGPFNWLAGVYYFHARDAYSPVNVNFGPTVASPRPNIPFTISFDDKQVTDSEAIYGQASYNILPATKLTLGGRYTWEHKTFDGLESFFIANAFAFSLPIPNPGSNIPTSLKFGKFTYRVSLDQKINNDVLLYLSYSTGFKSGGYNLGSGNNPAFNPETIKSLEFGVKSELFDHRLQLNAAAFHYDYTNIQVARFVQGTQQIYNGAAAKIYGVDLDFDARFGGGFSASGGFALVHSEFTSFPNADYVVPIGTCVPTPNQVCSGSAAGNRLPFTPTATFNLSLDYETSFAGGKLAADVTYFNSGKYYTAPDNATFQPNYDLINAYVKWSSENNRWSIQGWVRNIGNTKYAANKQEAGQGDIYVPGAPRTIGGTIGFSF